MLYPKLKYFIAGVLAAHLTMTALSAAAEPRLRLIVETDAGGDPDYEQSLVRLLVYANELDIAVPLVIPFSRYTSVLAGGLQTD